MRVEIPGATEIIIDAGLPVPLLPPRERGRCLLIHQPGAVTVAEEVAELVKPAARMELPDGDAAKQLAVLERIYGALDAAAVRRDGAIVAVGGGAATDVAGFAAATWLRGIEAIYVPTTLLGAVDAAVGGKTGINFDGKNLIGAFWHPTRVVIDLNVLARLPPSIAREGWAEILKAGLIADRSLIDDIERSGIEADLGSAVARAVRVKAEIVTADFRESGVRAHLNLGHTIGHALEVGLGISHGEAVGLGLVAEAVASEIDRGFPEADRVRELVASIGLPTRAQTSDSKPLVALMHKDKKADEAGLNMVMLDAIGEPVVARPSPDALAAAWTAVGLGGEGP